MSKFKGTGVALVTPFNEDLSVNYKALEALVEFNISNGINYLVISGTTGESVTITSEEKKQIVSVIKKKNNNRVPLVLGIGGNNTSSILDELNTTDLNGIDAILSVSPYYSKPTQEGIYHHFKTIAEFTKTPIILYNVPGRTGSNMLPETVIKLANDFENIIAVKEASGKMSQYLELLKNKPKDFDVISGDDDIALASVLAGGSGVISVIGQAIPDAFSKMINLGLNAKPLEAYKMHYKTMDLIALIFKENNPAGIKALLEIIGITNTKVRLPLVEASAELRDELKEAIQTFNN